MKRLIGVVFALCMVCIPMRIYANDELSFEYTGEPVCIEDALSYYSDDFQLLNGPPKDVGTYYVIKDGFASLFYIVPKKVNVKVSYNKDWRRGDLEEYKYLCLYDGDYDFKLRINTSNEFESLDSYNGNYEFKFDPPNVEGVPVLKTKISHEDVEYIYSGQNIKIDSGMDSIAPIVLKDAGVYDVCFDADSDYYESIPFKVTILPKLETVSINSSKLFGEKDPVFADNEKYTITREPGEDVGHYKFTITSKSKNYKYVLDKNSLFSILEKQKSILEPKQEENKGVGTLNPSLDGNETSSKEKEIVKEEVVVSSLTNKETRNINVPTGISFETNTLIFSSILSVAGIVYLCTRE